MIRNGTPKSKPRRSKRLVSLKGGNNLQTRFGVQSIFLPRQSDTDSKGGEKADHPNIQAFAQQTSFAGILQQCEIYIPANSNLWSKLPNGWEDGEIPS